MKIVPVITEKTTAMAKKGKYTFRFADARLTKNVIKREIEEAFKVKVSEIKTSNQKSVVKRNWKGKYVVKSKGSKKAVVSLKEGKIDLFEEEKKAKSK